MKYEDVYAEVLQLVDQEPSKRWHLEEVSGRLGYSLYHFHRIFKKVSGETFQYFLNNRRLSYSARELMTTSHRIIDIALDFEFGSHEAYSRAFKRNFHVTPTSFREHSAVYPFFEQNFMPSPGPNKQLPKLEYISGFDHVGMEAKQEDLVGKEWAKFIKEDLMKDQKELIGIIHQDPYRYVHGIKADKRLKTAVYAKTRISSNWYITLDHLGTYNTIKNTYRFLHHTWLPSLSLVCKNDPELEVYRKNKPVKICIPIEQGDV